MGVLTPIQEPKVQSELRNELLTLSPTMKSSSDAAFPVPKSVNDLPLLHAIVVETLRLHPAADGGQRRVVPSLSCKLHGHELPAGTVQLCTHMSIRSTVVPKSSLSSKSGTLGAGWTRIQSSYEK